MASFSWDVFLLTSASVPRITHALLQRGFTVSPMCSGSGGKQQAYLIRANAASVAMSLTLKHSNHVDAVKLSQFLGDIMRELEVPYYGSVLNDNQNHATPCGISMGYMPGQKSTLAAVIPIRKPKPDET